MSHLNQQEFLILQEALKVPPADVAGYLKRECAGDAKLFQRLMEAVSEQRKTPSPAPAAPEPQLRPTIRVSPIEPTLPKDSFPGYDLTREIHRGGQGVVYQALQRATKQKVAI